MTDLTKLTLAAALDGLEAKAFSSREITDAFIGAIEASMVSAQIAPNAVIARNPDFVKLAEAFGAGAVAPKSLSDMQEAVKAAFEAQGPTLIYITPQIVG